MNKSSSECTRASCCCSICSCTSDSRCCSRCSSCFCKTCYCFYCFAPCCCSLGGDFCLCPFGSFCWCSYGCYPLRCFCCLFGDTAPVGVIFCWKGWGSSQLFPLSSRLLSTRWSHWRSGRTFPPPLLLWVLLIWALLVLLELLVSVPGSSWQVTRCTTTPAVGRWLLTITRMLRPPQNSVSEMSIKFFLDTVICNT